MNISTDDLALINAAVAMIFKDEDHKPEGVRNKVMALSNDRLLFDVLQIGPYGYKTRCLGVMGRAEDFDLMIPVCEQPPYVDRDNRPDDDNPTPGSPVAMAA